MITEPGRPARATSADLLTQLRDLPAGTWIVDPTHSTVGFTARHLMVGRVRGVFRRFSAHIVVGSDPADLSVSADIDLASVDTGTAQRDDHLRSPDFFDVDTDRLMRYRGHAIHLDGPTGMIDGELTLRGVTADVPLAVTRCEFGADHAGGPIAGVSATARISRRAFGVDLDARLPRGGVVVADLITITLDIEASPSGNAG